MDHGLFPPGQSHAAAADIRSQSSDDMASSRELTSQYNQQTPGFSGAEKPDRNSADRVAIALLCVLSSTGSTSPSLAQTLKAPPHGRTSTTLNPINHQMTARGPALSVLSPFFSPSTGLSFPLPSVSSPSSPSTAAATAATLPVEATPSAVLKRKSRRGCVVSP